MRRRAFVLGMLALAGLPTDGRAQPQGKTARVGLMSPFAPSDTAQWHRAFRLGLRDLGWLEGKNLVIEDRYAHGRQDQVRGLIDELIRLNVDVIVTSVTTDALAAKAATRTIPIVMAAVGDPLVTGIVDNLARPGGNITGLSQMNAELVGKRLELLREAVPKLGRVAVFWNPDDSISSVSWQETQRAARDLGVQLHSLQVRTPADFERVFDEAANARAGALIIMPNPVFVTNLKRIAQLAMKKRLPALFHLREFAEAGGFVAYGPDRSDLFRRAAAYVDKILKGARPGDLPIEQPTKFELVFNMKTAKALGLKVPPALLLRADHVIE